MSLPISDLMPFLGRDDDNRRIESGAGGTCAVLFGHDDADGVFVFDRLANHLQVQHDHVPPRARDAALRRVG